MARAVIVSAPVGMGKSRLRQELLRRLAERGAEGGPPVEVWLARGDPMAQGSPFRMVAQAVRRATGLLDGETLNVRRWKIRARVARRLSGADAGRVSEFLGEVCGVPFPDEGSVQLRAARQDPVRMGDQMYRAFEDFMAAECAARPVLVVLEDLHWGDLPSVQWFDAALRNLRDRPLMVLALARPEVFDVFPTSGRAAPSRRSSSASWGRRPASASSAWCSASGSRPRWWARSSTARAATPSTWRR